MDRILALVGKQPMAVLIPILQYAPQSVHLIWTRQTYDVAFNISKVCADFLGEKTKVKLAEPEVLPYESGDTEARCLALAGPDTVINITSGTTPMNLGALRAAKEKKLPLLYVNTDENEIQRLDYEGNEIGEPDVINVEMSVGFYVRAHGIALHDKDKEKNTPLLQAHFSDAAKLLGNAGTASVALTDSMRWSANHAGQPTRIESADKQAVELAHKLVALNILENVTLTSDGQLTFQVVSTQAVSDFVTGKWLEVFIVQQIKNSNAQFSVCMGHHVQRETQMNKNRKVIVDNEIDVLAALYGRLAAISCKTGRLDRGTDDDDKRLPIYELDSVLLNDLIGLYCKKFLVTHRPIGAIPENLIARAKLSDIEIVSGDRLPDIAAIVTKKLMTSAL